MKRFKKTLGAILSTIGFIGFFATSESVNQLLVTGAAIILFYTGYRLLEASGALQS